MGQHSLLHSGAVSHALPVFGVDRFLLLHVLHSNDDHVCIDEVDHMIECKMIRVYRDFVSLRLLIDIDLYLWFNSCGGLP